MQVVNIHRRKISQSKENVTQLFRTLATKNDAIWPFEKWPAMRFQNGLEIGAKGGHGRIRYTVVGFEEGEQIIFKFTKPEGFVGTHALIIKELSANETEVRHEIKMQTATLKDSFFWITIIRWLHDALIEDAFDKLENHFLIEKKETKYSIWVTLLRELYKKKSFQIKQA